MGSSVYERLDGIYCSDETDKKSKCVTQMCYQPNWLEWLKWYQNDFNDFRSDLIDLRNDNNGLSSDKITENANALHKRVTNLIDLNDTKMT